jgi:hypothetical protein
VKFGSGGRIMLTAATAAVGAAVIAAAVIAAIVVLGSPTKERQRRLDAVRVDDLAAIERLIASFASLHKTLPHDLDSLAREPGYSVSANDPDSGASYEYEMLSIDSYRLCAIFKTRSSNDEPHGAYGRSFNATWVHGVGRQCFDRHADLAARAREAP